MGTPTDISIKIGPNAAQAVPSKLSGGALLQTGEVHYGAIQLVPRIMSAPNNKTIMPSVFLFILL